MRGPEMSIDTVELGFLDLLPRIDVTDATLTVRTNRILRILTLGSYRREVLVDSRSRAVTISRRAWWYYEEALHIAFDQVTSVVRQRRSIPTDLNIVSIWFGAYDELESYEIVLRTTLAGHPEIPLASFRGEGSSETGIWGVLIGGDSIVDFRGRQAHQSLLLVERVAKRLGVPGEGFLPIGGKPEPDPQGNLQHCLDCNRSLGGKAKRCFYCGGVRLEPRYVGSPDLNRPGA